MNKPSLLLEIPQLASWYDWTGIDPLPLIAGDRSCVLWLRSGSGDACDVHVRLPVKEGTCLFVPPRSEVTLRPNGPLRAVVYCVNNLQVQGFAKGFLSRREHPFDIPIGSDNQRINRILEDLLLEARNPQLGSQEVVSSLLQSLFIHFLREMDSAEQRKSDSASMPPAHSDPVRIVPNEPVISLAQNVRDYIEQNYHLELSLNDLAQRVYVSPYHLAHVFKEVVGMSPIQYLIKCRIDEAKRLLVETDYSVRDIALKVGYPNANYFNLLFSKLAGHSPGKFRKRH